MQTISIENILNIYIFLLEKKLFRILPRAITDAIIIQK